MAEAGGGDCEKVELGLPRREDLAELVLEAGRAGPSVDEDGPGRTAEQHGLAVADREDTGLRRRTGPHGEGGARNHCWGQGRGAEGHYPAAAVDVASDEHGADAYVVRHSRPGRKSHDGDGGGGHLRELVRDLLGEEEQARDGDRGKPREIRNEGERTEGEAGHDDDGENRQHQRIGDRSHRRKDVEIGGHHRERADLCGASDREWFTKEVRQAVQPPLNPGCQQDDRGGARE